METLVNKKVIYNPLSKVTMTSSLVPVCTFQEDSTTVKNNAINSDIPQRNGIVKAYGDEILANGGELEVADNGDIMVTKQIEEAYNVSINDSELISKDWFFMNVSMAEYHLMSSYEQINYEERIRSNILKRYLSEEERNLIYTDPQKYYKIINKVQEDKAKVIISVEATLQDWLESVFSNELKMIRSPLIQSIFKSIKIRQLSISVYTDIRTQLFGVARNFYPYLYFKNGAIYDLRLISTAPTKISDIPMDQLDPSTKSIYWKQITSTKKNMMTICKWTNVDYYALPEGWFKTWMYGSPVNTHTIGDVDGALDSIDVNVAWKGEWIEYTTKIDNAIATAALDKAYRKYIKDKWGEIFLVGIKEYRNTMSQFKFMVDYGFSVPVSKISNQTQTTFKFEEGEKFVIYFAFWNVDDGNHYRESEYFEPNGEPISTLNYIGVSRVQTRKSYAESNDWMLQPLISETNLKDNISVISKEMWYKQEFEYDEKYINDGYTKGNFYYMTKSKQTNSAGFIGLTCTVKFELPYKVNPETWDFYYESKTVTLRAVMSIADINDNQSIKDTISLTRYDLLAKLYTYIDMYVKNEMEIIGLEIDDLDDRMKLIVFAAAMRRCLVDVDYYTKDTLLNEIFTEKQRALYKVFPKTFNVINEKIDYFQDVEQVAESEYAYELKTYGGAKAQNQSYTLNKRINFVPVNLPFDIRDLKKNQLTINFNALVPSITSEYEQGGGFIGKMEYRLMEDIYIKYIVSRSKSFQSGLSNSEVVRFEVETFNTDGLEELYQESFPTIKKDISIILKRITQREESDRWERVYLDNSAITNLMYDHNYLTQTDSIRMIITVYNKD